MKERLSIALALGALVVAVLGSTSVGQAATNAVRAGFNNARSSTLAGPFRVNARKPVRRGPRGLRGPRGATGPQGIQGIQGPPGAPNPNADTLNGYRANELVRAAAATTNTVVAAGTLSTQKTVTITLPKNGYVLVTGSYSAIFTSGCPCAAFLRIRDPAAGGQIAPDAFAQLASGSWSPISQTWLFQETAGTYTFAIQSLTSAGVTVANPTITALYVPFGSSGGSMLSRQKPSILVG